MYRPIEQTNQPSRRTAILCVMVSVSFLGMLSTTNATEKKPEKTREVGVGSLILKVPASWKEETPSSRMRLTQFAIPAAKGDKEGGELAIFTFKGGGGLVKANLQRWIGQFDQKGRKVKLTAGMSTQGKYTLAEITGTYNKSIGGPLSGKKEKKPGSRMFASIVQNKGGVYYLKFTGPDKTISTNAEAFRASYGAQKSEEKGLKINK